jgi:hypothetical protein
MASQEPPAPPGPHSQGVGSSKGRKEWDRNGKLAIQEIPLAEWPWGQEGLSCQAWV